MFVRVIELCRRERSTFEKNQNRNKLISTYL